MNYKYTIYLNPYYIELINKRIENGLALKSKNIEEFCNFKLKCKAISEENLAYYSLSTQKNYFGKYNKVKQGIIELRNDVVIKGEDFKPNFIPINFTVNEKLKVNIVATALLRHYSEEQFIYKEICRSPIYDIKSEKQRIKDKQLAREKYNKNKIAIFAENRLQKDKIKKAAKKQGKTISAFVLDVLKPYIEEPYIEEE